MTYSSINIQGNIVSSDILTKIRQEELRYQTSADFGLDRNVSVREEIGLAWSNAQNFWKAFKQRRDRLKDTESGTSETRQGWMIPFLRELGYDLELGRAEILNGKSYAISHRAGNKDGFPVHIVGVNQSLDKRAEGGARLSPHALTQEYLNNTEHLYAIATNGNFLRVLRDATRLSRLSYLEFDLARMMEDELYAEFAILFRVMHSSRMPASQDAGAECIIEYYHQEALASGSRIRERLSQSVEKSMVLLANGLLHQAENKELQERISAGTISANDYYLYMLRSIYRVLFLMVIEERNLIYPDNRDETLDAKRKIYYDYYSLQRLAKLAERKVYVDPRKTDLWQSLLTNFKLFENGKFGANLGVQSLGAGLFGPRAIGPISETVLNNETFLALMRNLVTFDGENGQLARVNYADLDVEEFGSVYEGLLEYDPTFTIAEHRVDFGFVAGTGRSSSGSHYTPEELVKPLIKHSLAYIIADKLEAGYAEGSSRESKLAAKARQLLTITVCDVACGSGHILLSAARTIGMELAIVRESMDTRQDVEQPSPPYLRLAVRDAIRHCIYGVDKNPLAVELCKVALWLESHNPGEPLNFLDHRIKCGDAIVGLAHRSELENGIPDEAFKTLPGDDKEIASAFRNRNKQERKQKTQIGMFDAAVAEEVNAVIEKFNLFKNLPERTPDEVVKKEREYRNFEKSVERMRLKQLADAQVAQFFIPKSEATKAYVMTDAEYRGLLRHVNKGMGPLQSQKLAYVDTLLPQYRFFHWFVEFPEVLQDGGFDCVLGNPPFLGGQKLSGSFGDAFLESIKYQFTPIGAVDLVTYFFRRIFTIIRPKGFQSLISTNTIAQGRSREDGLDLIFRQGGSVNFAIKSMKWPGIAAVEVALVTITKQLWKGKFYLGTKEVKTITPYLDDAETLGNPFPLQQNEGKSFQGSIVLGKGFVLEPHEAVALIAKDTKYKDVLFPYLNGDDLNNNPDQSPRRWVINFFDWTHEKAKTYTDCYDIIEKLVKPERIKMKGDRGAEYWWQFLRIRKELYQTIAPLERVLVVARISKTVAFELLEKRKVFADALVVMPFSDYSILSLLQSTIHNSWAWNYCTTMKSDLNYTPGQTFDTFPFPKNLDSIKENKLENIGQSYHENRKQLMLNIQLGLTKTYNLFHSNDITTHVIQEKDKQVIALQKHLEKTEGTISFDQAIQDILKLRGLHVQMDEAVLEAYGWSDVALRHDFYEVDYLPENDRVRYTIHPDARKEVLKRLLLLNHERYEEEVAQGLHKRKDVEGYYQQKGKVIPLGIVCADDKKGRETKTKKTAQIDAEGLPNLFSKEIETTMKEFGLHEGIYTIHDTAAIINQPPNKVRRWFLKLSEAHYEGLGDTDIDERRISFHGLVELVVIGTLLENGFKTKDIFRARKDLGEKSHKTYPFATNNVRDNLHVAGKSIIFYFPSGPVTLNGSGQYNLELIREFFKDIEFSSEGLAQCIFPEKGNKLIVIDPKLGGGKPSIRDRKGIQVETVMRFYDGPESIPALVENYGISEKEIEAAIAYTS